MNFYASIERVLTQTPERELLTTIDGELYSRAAIDQHSARLANYLKKLGVQTGDRVSVQVHKSVNNMCLYLACLRGGFVFHPLNPAYQQSELAYFLKNAQPSLIVCDPEKLSVMRSLAKVNKIANVETMDATGGGTLSDNAHSCATEFATVPREGADIASLLYSSGTTGVP